MDIMWTRMHGHGHGHGYIYICVACMGAGTVFSSVTMLQVTSSLTASMFSFSLAPLPGERPLGLLPLSSLFGKDGKCSSTPFITSSVFGVRLLSTGVAPGVWFLLSTLCCTNEYMWLFYTRS